MRIDVPAQRYSDIEKLIHSDESPVGIDAKRTHVYILHLLLDIERRLRALEERPSG